MTEHDPNGPLPPAEDAEEDIYGVIPPDTPAAAVRAHKLIIPEIVSEEEEKAIVKGPKRPKNDKLQFTIRDMLLLTTAVAVCLSILTTIKWAWAFVAGLTGAGAFIGLIVLTVFEPENPRVRFAWWCVLGLYLLACIGAFIHGS